MERVLLYILTVLEKNRIYTSLDGGDGVLICNLFEGRFFLTCLARKNIHKTMYYLEELAKFGSVLAKSFSTSLYRFQLWWTASGVTVPGWEQFQSNTFCLCDFATC